MRRFTRTEIDLYFRILAEKCGSKDEHKGPEIVLVGDAGLLYRYEMKLSVPKVQCAVIADPDFMSVIDETRQKYGLGDEWLCQPLKEKTAVVRKSSTFYTTFGHILHLYVLNAEYLAAMKLKDGNPADGDLSSAVRLMLKAGKDRSVRMAYESLYDSISGIPKDSMNVLRLLESRGVTSKTYEAVRDYEDGSSENLKNYLFQCHKESLWED